MPTCHYISWFFLIFFFLFLLDIYFYFITICGKYLLTYLLSSLPLLFSRWRSSPASRCPLFLLLVLRYCSSLAFVSCLLLRSRCGLLTDVSCSCCPPRHPVCRYQLSVSATPSRLDRRCSCCCCCAVWFGGGVGRPSLCCRLLIYLWCADT